MLLYNFNSKYNGQTVMHIPPQMPITPINEPRKGKNGPFEVLIILRIVNDTPKYPHLSVGDFIRNAKNFDSSRLYLERC